MSKNIKELTKKALYTYNGLLHLAPAWVPRAFCIPGRRLKLHPDDLFALPGPIEFSSQLLRH